MEVLTAIILGVLQGVSEWLPVSSEAVITLVMTQVLGRKPVNAVNTAIYLHVGTMLAAFVYFRDDFIEILWALPEYLERTVKDPSSLGNRGVINFLVISTAVSSALGGLLYVFGIKSLPSNPDLFAALVGLALLGTGVMKILGEESNRLYTDAGAVDSVLAGALQGLAIIPGISRSGSTVFGLFYREFSSQDAFKLSFLMSVPAILIAQIGINLFSGFAVSPGLLVAALAAFVSGYASIEAVLQIADRVEIGYIALFLAILSFLPLLL